MAGTSQYAERLRMAMKTTENPQRHEVTIRDLSKALDYSYEHVRKIVHGEPYVSREFNDALCQYLGLDADEMWALAQRTKLHAKFGAELTMLPRDDRLFHLWPKLTKEDRERLLQIAQGYALANDALHEQSAKRKKIA